MTALHEQRLDFALAWVEATGARSVLDLGCGSGSLLHRLLQSCLLDVVVGLETSGASLLQARNALGAYLHGAGSKLSLIRGSYAEANVGLAGFDAATMIETIEHVPPGRLGEVERAVFGQYRPRTLLMTTPNREYNPLFGLGPGELREPDHCFEWDRAKFRHWTVGVARRNGYSVRIGGIGEFDPDCGEPTQYAVFSRLDATGQAAVG